MDDALKIASDPNGYLFNYEMYGIMRSLGIYLTIYDFGGARSEDEFRKNIYQPFITQLQKLSPEMCCFCKMQ